MPPSLNATAFRGRVPLRAAVGAARAVGALSRASGRGGGTTLPGRVLLALDDDAGRTLADGLALGSAVVSATNGKTTTCAMAAEILTGVPLCRNAAGANLLSGVASALAASAGDAALGLFEVDEAALPAVVDELAPHTLALGNLFRDQLDRYGELELVAERWRELVRRLPPEAVIVAGVDDPVCAGLVDGREVALRYGIDDDTVALDVMAHASDSRWCVRCGTGYDYRTIWYGHLGDYLCPACGHRRPPLDVAARDVRLLGLEATAFRLCTPLGNCEVRLAMPGLYNVSNALAAATLALALGASLDEVRIGLQRFRPAFGRFQQIALDDRRAVMLLIKNPAGANEVVRVLAAGAGDEMVALLALNDMIADGRDISWIWDVDWERLVPSFRHVVVSGTRAEDLALRLKYAGLEPSRLTVERDLTRGLDAALDAAGAGGVAYLLPTYTAMLDLQRTAAGRGLVRPYWEEPAT